MEIPMYNSWLKILRQTILEEDKRLFTTKYLRNIGATPASGLYRKKLYYPLHQEKIHWD